MAAALAGLAALVASAVVGVPAEETGADPTGGSSVEIEKNPDESPPAADPTSELKPDPYDDKVDEDSGEPLLRKALPAEGQALRPGLPYLERDLVSPRSHPAGRGAATIGFGSIGEDEYLSLNVGYVFLTGKWRIAPRLTLRLRIVDDAPETADVIRTEDWDEPSDFARLLAFVQYGSVGDPLVFRYGELNGITIGHGSLVNRYFNTIDIDHYQGGIYLFGDADIIGAEILLNDVFHPDVFLGRVFVRPFVGQKSLGLPLRGLKLAVSAGADIAAPKAIAEEDGRLFATPEWQPDVLADEVLPMFGVDLEVPVLSSPSVDIVPYVDFATLDFVSLGMHIGTYVNARFSPEATLRTRFEYRWVGVGHDPGYVSPFYEIERFAYHGGPPKLAALEDDAAFAESYSGGYFESDLQIRKILSWSFIFSTSGRDRPFDLLTRLKLLALGPVRLTLFLASLGFDDFSELFDNDRTLMGIAARVLVYGPIFVRGRIVQEWWLARDERGVSRYGTTTDWDVSGGVLFTF